MIDVVYRESGVRAGRGALGAFTRAVAAEALAQLGKADASLTVMYCSEAEIHRLNREFLDEDRPTDVLSFPSEEEPYLGDLAICLPYVLKAAAEAAREPNAEVALMIVHGILHLVGHDHDTAPRKKAMWKEQDAILARCRDIAFPDNLDVRGIK